MCHSLKWQDWELLQREELREDEEPRVVEVASEAEGPEPQPEREPERELVRV